MPDRVMALVARAAPYLGTHGSGSPRLDAELLLAEALGIGRMDLYLQFDRPLKAEEVDRFRELCRRRAGGEPVAYIRGRREFMSVDLLVTPAVMIPRPETELLVEEALRRDGDGGRVLDVGTGSGAIAVAMAVHHPGCRVVATDVSAEALKVASRNVERLELQDRIELHQGDLAAGIEGPFELVLANLPYIDRQWPEAVTPEVAASEPEVALYGGRDGLELVARLLDDLPRVMAPGGSALLEVDPRNAQRAMDLAGGRSVARLIKDLAGHDRVLVVQG
ncbi:MAG: peptide chain release factor N(5)-glutamine methyltransferase [Candidatus Dormibacteraeota bacterium]|nr:peptide chain release factor N(5)-glutamine methyltransferase [Candidatus Dormibacteraeota bacterium]